MRLTDFEDLVRLIRTYTRTDTKISSIDGLGALTIGAKGIEASDMG